MSQILHLVVNSPERKGKIIFFCEKCERLMIVKHETGNFSVESFRKHRGFNGERCLELGKYKEQFINVSERTSTYVMWPKTMNF